jgi:putative membrane protein
VAGKASGAGAFFGLTHLQFLLLLAAILAIEFIALAISPSDRSAWMLENALVLAFVAVMFGGYRILTLSRVSYLLIFIFLSLHLVGAHYTYAAVPYDQWFESLTGTSLNALFGWERNHFDRLVHFSYGLLLAYPIREVFLRVANLRGFWGYFFPLDITMSTSMIYELIEWLAAILFGGGLGMAFLGTQGDEWDAHKDMALASCGALIAMLVTAALNISVQRDFAAEWQESLRVKGKRPLGEDEFVRLRDAELAAKTKSRG